MKTSLLTIALAVATMPMIFAKSQVPPPANTGSATKPAVTATKKHTKKPVKKGTSKTNATPAAAAKPATTPAAPAAPAAKPSK